MRSGEPFVLATGIAALMHSTWSLTVLFSGGVPDVRTAPLDWLGAVLPAVLLAFAIDVGQIMTSRDIRAGQRNLGKVATFVALAFATYYLQWVYMVAHVPAIALGAGVRPEWQAAVTHMRDLAIWFVPALLPIATTLYTVSDTRGSRMQSQSERMRTHANAYPSPAIAEQTQSERKPSQAIAGQAQSKRKHDLRSQVVKQANETYVGTCVCGYETGERPTRRSATSALAAHLRACPGPAAPVASSNGNGSAAHG